MSNQAFGHCVQILQCKIVHMHRKLCKCKLFIDNDHPGCYHEVVKSLIELSICTISEEECKKEELNERSNDTVFR